MESSSQKLFSMLSRITALFSTIDAFDTNYTKLQRLCHSLGRSLSAHKQPTTHCTIVNEKSQT